MIFLIYKKNENLKLICSSFELSLTYDLEEGREEVEAARPGEADLRVMAERSYGCTEILVDGDAISVTRMNVDGVTSDSFSIELS